MRMMRSKRFLLLAISASLAVIGGALIVVSGFRTKNLMLSALSYSDKRFVSSSPAFIQVTAGDAIILLSLVMSLGGILAIVGGISLLLRHVSTGSTLIALGGGAGFISIVIAIGYSWISSGATLLAGHFEYWVGVVIATIARWLAKRA
jgi:hypothetical protein